MSGHNKWSKIKNQKAGTDKEKGKLYTLHARKISLAQKEGKGLMQAIEAAKAANVPRHVIDRALKKNAEGKDLKDVMFEGFLAGGKICLIILGLTDNTTRVSSLVKNVLERHGGKFAEPGALTYMFNKLGVFYVERSDVNINLIMDSGADDFFEEDDEIRVETEAEDLKRIADFFKEKNIEIFDEEFVYAPILEIELSEEEKNSLDKTLSSLELIDDVQTVFTNAKN